MRKILKICVYDAICSISLHMELTENFLFFLLQVSPLSEMDKILDCELRPTISDEQDSSDAAPKPVNVKQYLVKWKGLSYLHCSWYCVVVLSCLVSLFLCIVLNVCGGLFVKI